MLKTVFVFILGLLLLGKAHAQSEKDTVVYYMKNSSDLASSKAKADFFRVILPADSNSPKLFPFMDYYLNGKRKLSGMSKTRTHELMLEGTCISFFPNGSRNTIITFTSGIPTGDMIEFYPNGKVYASKTFLSPQKVLLIECRDSSGRLLAEKGKGQWLKFNTNFLNVIAQGPVKDGMENGQWHGTVGDSVKYDYVYNNGEIKSGTSYDKNGKAYPFTTTRIEPQYPGGQKAFNTFVKKHTEFFNSDKKNDYDVPVIVSFIVEQDGTLSNFRMASNTSESLFGKATTILKLSEPWIPGLMYGLPTRMVVTIPLGF